MTERKLWEILPEFRRYSTTARPYVRPDAPKKRAEPAPGPSQPLARLHHPFARHWLMVARNGNRTFYADALARQAQTGGHFILWRLSLADSQTCIEMLCDLHKRVIVVARGAGPAYRFPFECEKPARDDYAVPMHFMERAAELLHKLELERGTDAVFGPDAVGEAGAFTPAAGVRMSSVIPNPNPNAPAQPPINILLKEAPVNVALHEAPVNVPPPVTNINVVPEVRVKLPERKVEFERRNGEIVSGVSKDVE